MKAPRGNAAAIIIILIGLLLTGIAMSAKKPADSQETPPVGSAGRQTTSSGASALSGLSDVSITSAAYGDVLMYTGSAWADTATSTLFGQNLTTAGSPTFTAITIASAGTLTLNTGAINGSGAGTKTINLIPTGDTGDGSFQAYHTASAHIGIQTNNATPVYVASDLNPETTATYNFGSASLFWKNAYLTYASTTVISSTGNAYFATSAGSVGVASTSPAYGLSIGSGKAIGVQEYVVSTSSSMTLDARNGNQQLVQIGTGAVTIGFSNMGIGTTIRVMVCNPGSGTAGTITWSGVHYFGGTAPTQTTTAKVCDMYVAGSTAATSSPASTPLTWLSQGGAGLQ